MRADDVARELDHAALQSKAQAEVGNLVFTRVTRGEHLALDAAVAETSGHDDSCRAAELLGQVVIGQRLGVDPADDDRPTMSPAGVPKGLSYRQVGVGQLDVLADEGDFELRLGPLDQVD